MSRLTPPKELPNSELPEQSVSPSKRKRLFRCNCGQEFVTTRNSVQQGSVKSCGCFRRESCSQMGKQRATHGAAVNNEVTPEYRSWLAMKSRCTYKDDIAYERYGGAGILICDQWLDSFRTFLVDMGFRPDGTSLERINNDLGYTPENCKWATPREQANNRKNTIYLLIDGETRSISDWIRVSPVSSTTVRRRLAAGMTPQEAVFTPSTQGCRLYS